VTWRTALAALARSASLSAAMASPVAAQQPPADEVGMPRVDAHELEALPLDAERRARIDQALRTASYAEAQTLLLEEVGRTPSSPELLRLLGGVLFLTGDYLSSAIALKKAEALSPLDARSRFTLAMSYVVMGQPGWAKPELQTLAGADPHNALYPYWLARLDYDDNQYLAAVQGFRRALELDAGYLKAHDNLGLALEAVGRYDEAIQSYQEALRLDRQRHARSPWPALNLGILLTRLDRLDEAEPLFRESSREDPRFAPAHYQLGLVLEKKGATKNAIDELRLATQLDPHYPEPHYALARLFRRAGEASRADESLERFLLLKKQKGQAGAEPH
jgi:tetratricopeptide (TPR) repeat protein